MQLKSIFLFSVIIVCLFCLLVITSCKKTSPPEFNNPNDSTGTTFLPPKTDLFEQPSGTISDDSTIVKYSWREGTTTTISFSYRLDSSDWSDFLPFKTVTFIFLDEGQHVFSVRSRHQNGNYIEKKYPIDTFFVDAINERSVYFYKRTKIVTQGTPFLYQINVEKMDSFFAARLNIAYDNQLVRIDSIIRGSFLGEHNLIPVLFPSIDSINNNNGRATINIATTGSFLSNGLNDGTLITLFCSSISLGESFFSYESVSFRNPQNSVLSVKPFNGRIIIK